MSKLQCCAGALAGLQRKYAAKLGVQWAATGQPLGQFLYSAYTEKDYEVIWDEYLYISRDNWWVDMDFGKANCSAAHPRRADIAPSLQDVWVAEVSKHGLQMCVMDVHSPCRRISSRCHARS